MKIKLPNIIDSAKSRPLSIDPESGSFIYYDAVKDGEKKIVPLEKLDSQQLIRLAIQRQLENEPSTTVTLNGETLTNEDVAKEIEQQSKIGKQLFNMDINYLKYYLSQFPEDSFEK